MKKDKMMTAPSDEKGGPGRGPGRRGAPVKSNKRLDEDEVPLRQRARESVEGNLVTVIMSLTTIYALVGDDFRLWFTPKSVDDIFNACTSAAFVLFAAEILVNSCVVNDFKFTFFWWLDCIATLSLIPDIPWIIDLFSSLIGIEPSWTAVDVIPGVGYQAPGSTRVVELVKSVRLIRLIRIIKLYKYAVKKNT